MVFRLENAGLAFDNRWVWRDVSLEIAAGETVIMVGGSGVGKSTLLKVLMGFLPLTEGKLFFENEPVKYTDTRRWLEIRNRCGMVFQQAALFDTMTVFENVALKLLEAGELPYSQLRALASESIRAVGLPPAVLDQYPAALSGGMRKRVSIARATITQPGCLLYDEPTAGLDPPNANRIDELILSLAAKGTTTLVITHDLNSVQKIGGRVIFLANQRLHFDGTVKDFFVSADPLISDFCCRSFLT